MSSRIFSSAWPVCLASIFSNCERIRRISFAWISMSLDLPAPALAGRLVDQDAGVRQRHPLARRAGGEQHGGGGRRLAHADRLDVGRTNCIVS